MEQAFTLPLLVVAASRIRLYMPNQGTGFVTAHSISRTSTHITVGSRIGWRVSTGSQPSTSLITSAGDACLNATSRPSSPLSASKRPSLTTTYWDIALKKTRMTLRIKPGRFLRIPLRFFKRTNWQSGDRLNIRLDKWRVYLFKPPKETDWRIGRLRNRINLGNAGNSPIFAARTYT